MDESIKTESNETFEKQNENISNLEENLKIAKYFTDAFSVQPLPLNQYSPLALAFIGDGIYDLVIRTVVVEEGNAPVNKLHHKVSHYVKAAFQASLVHVIEPYLTEEEKKIYKRGRNAKSFTKAKNATVIDYRQATGLETLMGYLYLDNQMDRAIALIRYGIETINKVKK